MGNPERDKGGRCFAKWIKLRGIPPLSLSSLSTITRESALVVCTRVPKFHGDRRAYPRIYFRSAHDRTNGVSLSLSRCHCNNWQCQWRRPSHSNSLSCRHETEIRGLGSMVKIAVNKLWAGPTDTFFSRIRLIPARANSTWNFDKSRGDTAGRAALPWTDPSGRKRIGPEYLLPRERFPSISIRARDSRLFVSLFSSFFFCISFL